MPFDKFDASDSAETKVAVKKEASGTVLKYFHGPTRRFNVGYVIVDADSADLPMSMDDLKTKGFIA